MAPTFRLPPPFLPLVYVAALVACGSGASRVPTDGSPAERGGNDASVGGDAGERLDGEPDDAKATKEAGTLPTVCDPTKAFSTLTPILSAPAGAALNSAFVSADERTLLYDLTDVVSGQAVTEVATRGGASEPFGPAHREVGLDNGYKVETAAWIADDGLTSYVSTVSLEQSTDQIYRFTRPALGAAWSASTLAAGLDPGGTLARLTDPFVLGERIYYTSVPSTEKASLFSASLASPAPTALGGLPTNGDASNPILTPDGLTLYFAFVELGTGVGRVWRATRLTIDASFEAPSVVDVTTTPAADSYWPVGVSADDCRLYAMHSPVGVGVENQLVVIGR